MAVIEVREDIETELAKAATEFSVIAVQSYGSAGSLFLHSLLDSHPDVLGLPALLGVQYYVSWSIRTSHVAPDQIGYASMKALIMDFFSMVYDREAAAPFGLTDLGDEMNEDAVVDREEFSRAFDVLFERLASEKGLPPADKVCAANIHSYRTICLKAVYIAYAYLLGQDIARKKFLLYPAHGGPMTDIGGLCEDFDDVRFVHMVREPVGNFDSIQRRLVEIEHSSEPTLSVFWCVTNQIYYDRAPHAPVCGVPMYAIHPYPTARPGKSVAIQLDRLHREPKRTLASLCRFLGLAWSDTLLNSSFAGKKWWNMRGLRRVWGFSTGMTGRAPQFGGFDQWRMRWLAAPIGANLGYSDYKRDTAREWLALLLSILLPFGLELRQFSLRRCIYRLAKLSPFAKIAEPAKDPLLRALAVVAYPFFLAGDFIATRVVITRGFLLNRSRRTSFVPLMEMVAE